MLTSFGITNSETMSRYYAEDQIDRVVRETFFQDISYRGLIVEVGEAGPEYLSIRRSLRDYWRTVLALEPNPYFCELHRKAGFDVLQYACGDHDENDVDFEVVYQPAQYKDGQVTYESADPRSALNKKADEHS